GGDVAGGSVGNDGFLDRSGFVEGGRIARLFIGGSVIAGTATGTGVLTNSGAIRADEQLGHITVVGSLIGNPTQAVTISAQAGRQVKTKTEFRTVTRQIIVIVHTPCGPRQEVRTVRELVPVQVAVEVNIQVAIRSLRVSGRGERAQVLAGYDMDNDPLNGAAKIGAIRVAGDWIASSVAAGVVDVNGDGFGNGDDAKIPGGDNSNSKIGRIVIQGQAQGTVGGADHFGFVAQQIGTFSVGGTIIPLKGGPHNDDLAVGSTGDLRLREV